MFWRFIDVLHALDFECFPKLLLIQLSLGHLLLVAPEVLDSEPDSAQFNGVELLDLVVILALLVFQ